MVNINLKLNTVLRPFNQFAGFLGEMRVQMRKIDWPSRKEALSYTMVVIFASVLLAIFLGGVDFLLTLILDRIIL